MQFYLAAGFFNKTPVLVDMSCGTGLFTRKFNKSNLFDRVIACDYSDSMLRETRWRLERDNLVNKNKPFAKVERTFNIDEEVSGASREGGGGCDKRAILTTKSISSSVAG